MRFSPCLTFIIFEFCETPARDRDGDGTRVQAQGCSGGLSVELVTRAGTGGNISPAKAPGCCGWD